MSPTQCPATWRPASSPISLAEHTLHLLYSAQQPQANHSGPGAHAAQIDSDTMESHPDTRQSSLHNFWVLPGNNRILPTALRSTSLDTITSARSNLSLSCAECGLDASTAEMMDDGMVIDSTPFLEGATNAYGTCSQCDRTICQQCSISNLDEQRICLSCTRSLQKSRAPLSSVSYFFTRH